MDSGKEERLQADDDSASMVIRIISKMVTAGHSDGY